jgi:hypothetical protein
MGLYRDFYIENGVASLGSATSLVSTAGSPQNYLAKAESTIPGHCAQQPWHVSEVFLTQLGRRRPTRDIVTEVFLTQLGRRRPTRDLASSVSAAGYQH